MAVGAFTSFPFITLDLELSDTKVYEPYIRALLGTTSHYCEAVVLESRAVPFGTALSARNQNHHGRQGFQRAPVQIKAIETDLLLPF